MDGENRFYHHAGGAFAVHRQTMGIKGGFGDTLIGAAQAIAEYNVLPSLTRQDKIIEMCHLNETLYACGIACSAEGRKTAAGNYLIDLLLANICKQNVTRFPYEMSRLVQDIAGGYMVTMPSEQDFNHPEIGPLVAKYSTTRGDIPAEHRQRMLRYIENLTLGSGAVGYLTESMHGARSPRARDYDFPV